MRDVDWKDAVDFGHLIFLYNSHLILSLPMILFSSKQL